MQSNVTMPRMAIDSAMEFSHPRNRESDQLDDRRTSAI
jgi:hypothetical protein